MIVDYIERQIAWSRRTFGSGRRTLGIIKHIQKELGEIAVEPTSLEEWIDVMILAIDGAWRSGYSPADIVDMLSHKQVVNMARQWPPVGPEDEPTEHIRDAERCPDCDSPSPELHPAVQHEGEVHVCANKFHSAEAVAAGDKQDWRVGLTVTPAFRGDELYGVCAEVVSVWPSGTGGIICSNGVVKLRLRGGRTILRRADEWVTT
jgi:hypothetical protein